MWFCSALTSDLRHLSKTYPGRIHWVLAGVFFIPSDSLPAKSPFDFGRRPRFSSVFGLSVIIFRPIFFRQNPVYRCICNSPVIVVRLPQCPLIAKTAFDHYLP